MVISRKCLIFYRNTVLRAGCAASGRQFGKVPEKSTDLFGIGQGRAEERRGRRRRTADAVLAGKTVGVTLPGRVVIATGSVDEQQVGGDAELESGSRGAVRPVEVGQVEAVEVHLVEGDRLEGFAF